MDNERISQIEVLLAHHERQIEELSEMTTRQWDEIDLLKRRLDSALSRLKEIEIGEKEDQGNAPMTVTDIAAAEKPPHY